jgi:hypothetical protein
MLSKTFFKLFPPPKYLNIPYAGLGISDDAIHCLEYSISNHGYTLLKYGSRQLRQGVIESGYVKDEASFIKELISLRDELKISTVRVSLPEERMYLFRTDISDINDHQIRQNIEFKLEENVPLPASEAVFFFDKFPRNIKKDKNFVSVSVAPRDLVNSYLQILQKAGLTVISFEIQAKAIARAVVSNESSDAQMIIHITNKKTGLYIVCGGVVCFTSTIAWGGEMIRGKNVADIPDDIFSLRHEIEKVYSYWSQHGEMQPIKSIIISGHDALVISQISHLSPDPHIILRVADVWQNAFSINHYIPKITLEESLDYATAAGLALPQ